MVRRLNKDDSNKVIELLYTCNNDLSQYIPFCARKREAIKEDCDTFFEDEICIGLGYEEDGCLKGVLFLDVEEERAVAEVTALFILDDEKWHCIAEDMFKYALQQATNIQRYIFFVGGENQRLVTFVETIGATFKNDETVLSISCSKYKEINIQGVTRMDKENIEEVAAVVKLHDTLFPDTYYTGEQMIDLIEKDYEIGVVKEGKRVRGYTFIQYNQSLDWAYIHFIGVEESCRGKGYGKRLTAFGTQTLFEKGMSKVRMCVEVDNEKALDIYRKIGYTVESVNKAYDYKRSVD